MLFRSKTIKNIISPQKTKTKKEEGSFSTSFVGDAIKMGHIVENKTNILGYCRYPTFSSCYSCCLSILYPKLIDNI